MYVLMKIDEPSAPHCNMIGDEETYSDLEAKGVMTAGLLAAAKGKIPKVSDLKTRRPWRGSPQEPEKQSLK